MSSVVPHGTHGGYTNHSCRCVLCRNAARKAMSAMRLARNRAQQRLIVAHRAEFKRYYEEEARPLGVRVGQLGRPPKVGVTA